MRGAGNQFRCLCLPMIFVSALLLSAICGSLAFSISSVVYEELLQQSSVDDITSALTTDGILFITQVPRLTKARNLALRTSAQCAWQTNDADGILVRDLPDGTQRRTIGAQMVQGSREKLQVGGGGSSCISLNDDTESLRSIMDQVLMQLTVVMDKALLGDTDTPHLFRDSVTNDRYWSSFSSLIAGGDHLEHFHTYSTELKHSSTIELDQQRALEYHTDAGLFILFTPAAYLSPNGDDFYDDIQNPHFFFRDRAGHEHGVVVTRESAIDFLPTGAIGIPPDTVVVMMGQGAEQWLNPQLLRSPQYGFRAVPHALDFSRNPDGMAGLLRSWYGRMILPPRDAALPRHEISIGNLDEYSFTGTALRGAPLQQFTTEGNHYHHPVACGTYDISRTQQVGLLAVNPLADGDCMTGEIYCWMQCMQPSEYNITCPMNDVTCVDNDGNEVDPDEMDSTHHLGCVGVETDTSDKFCQGSGVDMYMQGFVSYLTGKYREHGGTETPQCLALWFEEWELDTRTKFNWACIGCLFLGTATEAVSWIRRNVKQLLRGQPLFLEIPVMCFLYAGQLTLGYFDMLVAMTYQVELFVCVVLGLAVGHGIFSILLLRLKIDSRNLGKSKGSVIVAGDVEEESVRKGQYQVVKNDADAMRSKLLPSNDEDVADPCCQFLHVEED